MKTSRIWTTLSLWKKTTTVFNNTYTRLSSNTKSNILKSPYPDIAWPPVLLHNYVWKDVARWSDKIALECAITDRTLTYRESKERSHRIAIMFQSTLNLSPKDTIAVYLPNVLDYPLILIGASEAGLVTTTINYNYIPVEIAKQLKDSKAKIIITNKAKINVVKEACEKLNYPISIVITDEKDTPAGCIPFNEALKTAIHFGLNPVDQNIEDDAVLPYSSGTTGLPKGVQLTHRNLVANLEQLNYPGVRLLQETTETQQDSVLAILPFYHIYGMVVVSLSSLSAGAKIVCLPQFDPKTFVSTIVEKQISILYVVPPLTLFLLTNSGPDQLHSIRLTFTGAAPLSMSKVQAYLNLTSHSHQLIHVPPLVIFLGNHPSVKPESLKSLRGMNSGAAPIGHKDVEKLLEKAPQMTILQGYGMTETSPVTLTSHRSRLHKYASCGVLVPNTEAKIVDSDSGDPLPANKVGELRVKGPQVQAILEMKKKELENQLQCMKGYFNQPKETEDTFDSDGFLKTGDLAYYDDEGDFYIVDRLKELIKVKGFQVAPAELEEILRTHPAVLDSAVIGVPDTRAGELPRGFVVLKPGATATAEEIHQHVNQQVTEYKRLAGGVVFLNEIPKSAAGKILRKELRAKYGS